MNRINSVLQEVMNRRGCARHMPGGSPNSRCICESIHPAGRFDRNKGRKPPKFSRRSDGAFRKG